MLLRTAKRLLFSSVFLVVFVTTSFSQLVGDYRSKIAGNWNVNANWERCTSAGTWTGATNIFPPVGGAGAAVTITISHTMTVNVAVSNNSTLVIAASGTLQTPAAISFTNAATGVITNNGTITNSVTLATGSFINNGSLTNNLTITSNGVFTNNLTINNSASGTITQNGAGAFTNAAAGTITNLGTLTVVSPRTITSNGTIHNSGTINSGGAFGTLVFGATTGYYKHNFTASAGTIPTSTWNTNSTCEIIACGSSAPSGLSQAFRHFIWNYSTQPSNINLNGALTNIQGNFSVTSTSASNVILKTTSGASTTVNGNLLITGGNLVIEDNSSSFAGVNTLSVGGSFTMSSGSCSLTTSTGTAVGSNGNGFLSISGTSTISGGTLNVASSSWGGASGGNGTFNAAGGLTLSGGTINVCSSGSSGNVGNGTIDCGSTLTISSGTLNLSSSTTTGGGGLGVVNVNGDFTHTGGTVSKTGVNSGTINISGTIAQAIESIGFNAPNVIAFNISQTGAAGCSIAATKTFVLNTGTTLSINDNPSFTTDLTISGTLTANTNTWICDPASETSVASTGIFINNSTGVIASNSIASSLLFTASSIFRVAGNGGEVATATWNSTSNVEITGITSATTIGNGGQSFGKINWNSTSQTASTDFGATGFGVQTDYTLTSTGTGVARFPDVDFTIGTSVSATNRLILSGTSVLQVANAANLYATGNRTITINGHVTIAAGALMKVGSPNTGSGSYVADQTKDFTLSIKRNFTAAASTNLVTFDHRSFASFGDESYHLIFNFSGNAAQTVNIPVSASNMVVTSGDGTPNSGTDDEFTNTNPYSISVTGASTALSLGASIKSMDFSVASSNSLLTTASAFSFIDYSLLLSTGATYQPSMNISGTINFGNAASTLTDASGTGTFTLNSGATLLTKNAQGITSTGSGLTGCVRVTGTRTYSTGANYTYNATANSQVTGDGLPTALLSGTTLTINNTFAPLATNGVTLTQSTSTAGTLTLTSGRFITASGTLMTIAAGGSASSGSANAFVDGPLKKIGNTAFVFPVGDVYTASPTATNKWARIGISAPSSVSDAFTAEYDKINDPCNVSQVISTSNGAGIDHVSYKEYWNLSRDVGSSVPTVTLYWESGSTATSIGSAISSTASTDLHVAEFYSSQWNTLGQGSVTGVAAGPGTISNSSAATFSGAGVAMAFTFSAPNIVNPLPVELLHFNGNAVNDGNQIVWTTATETNCDRFDLERSSDGTNFDKIFSVSGQGNSTDLINYNYFDAEPFSGINYYRLNQFDFDGGNEYSEIISIDRAEMADPVIQIYPNPSNDIVHIISSENVMSVMVYNMLGEVVFSATANEKNIQFDPISKGIYLVKATSKDGKESSIRLIRN